MTYRILHIFGKMDRGGAEMRTLDLLRHLKTRVHRDQITFDFCALSGLPGELDAEIRMLGGQIHYLSLGSGFGHRFKALLKENSYDSVHSHVHLFSGYLLRLADAAGVRSRICHLHTTGGYGQGQVLKWPQYWLSKKWLYAHSTALIAVSEGVANIFIENARLFVGDKRLNVIYDGVDPRSFVNLESKVSVRESLKLSAEHTVVAHVGRFDPVKNHSRLLEIFAAFSNFSPGARLLLIGKTEPVLLAELTAKAKALRILEQVHFLGERSDVPDLLNASDLVIFPSLWEGLPGAVLEASVLNIPVVSSDVVGSVELAKYFSTVSVLPLAKDNETWALQSIKSLRNSRDDESDRTNKLDGSPFSVAYSLRLMMPLWIHNDNVFELEDAACL